ncbi:Guanine nucleotide-binding protein subunit alpha [Serendipita indica DSM 11827]|uniref:Probable G protein alpha subunit GNA-3 n=1 Tax=Serendipita indica (strain DSM 11827) TaxID=1109443 RepID=G4TDW5_SERID|nr:Guanine nucleotide-binding protein subunit alpha [Serendipita indica DSM 11827]CCA69503.1 probable G protein alpha subunit GNA-3 [Serendipita indica DSM 11827]
MGGCSSVPDKAQRERSEAIDRQIEEDSRQFKKECKILLLGSGESGKSTIVKQMKIIHQNGYTHNELLSFRPTIFRNLVDSAQDIVLAMRKLGVDPALPENRQNAEKIMDYRVDALLGLAQPAVGALLGSAMHAARNGRDRDDEDPYDRPSRNMIIYPPRDPKASAEASKKITLDAEIAQAIHALWADPIISDLMDHSSDFYLMDSAPYFFSEVLRIGAPDYVPNEADVLRARAKSSGIAETRFNMGQLSIHMFDVGGQRSERKKWIHCFEAVTSIIFCVALSEYDQMLLEASGQNRMLESLVLFESVINSRWFARTSIILFLNKIDVFKAKLPRVPLEKYFSDYAGGSDVNKAAKYILWRFMQVNRARLSIYPHLTQATDTGNVRLVFAAVKETILQNALRDSGIL